MRLFRKKSTRQLPSEPLPDWDDTRWRSHLRSNALGTEHHCGIYVQMINDDRKEAARLFKNDDPARARSLAESAIRNNRTVTALAALNPLSNALYQRSEPLAGYTSLVQIPEPARSGIVTLIFAAGRLHMSYLTDTVTFLKEQFANIHIDQIQAAEGELYPLVNATVRDALSPAPATHADVDRELASAVKQFFGIEVPPTAPSAPSPSAPPPSAPAPLRARTSPIPALSPAEAAAAAATTTPQRARTTAFGATAAAAGVAGAAIATANTTTRSATHDVTRAAAEALPTIEARRAQTTPLSATSEEQIPLSPQLSSEQGRPPVPPASAPASDPVPVPEEPRATRSRMYAAATAPARYTAQTANAYPLGASEHASTAYPLGMPEPLSASVDSAGLKRGRADALADAAVDEVQNGARERYDATQRAMPLVSRMFTSGGKERNREEESLGTRSITDLRTLPAHIRRFDDGDKVLILRYEDLREVLAV